MFIKQIQSEILTYTENKQQILPSYSFSQYELVQDIMMFQSNKYYSGNIDSQKNYKFWTDIIGPRLDSEIKNIDFDTKDIILYSDNPKDSTGVFLANSELKQYLKTTSQAEILNEAVEQFSAFGNVVFKKVKNGYILWDPLNFYITNLSARTLDQTNVIECQEMNVSELEAHRGIWDNDVLDKVIKECQIKGRATTEKGVREDTENIYYKIYERNGNISLYDFKELRGEKIKDNDKEKFILAKLILAGIGDGKILKSGNEDNKQNEEFYLLYSGKLKKTPYIEAHRGRYQGRWFRTGLYELLMDTQIAINYNVNEIRQALEFGAKQIFRSSDTLIAKNILTDMERGDVVKSSDLQQVMTHFPQINEWVVEYNRLIQLADRLANSYEVAAGETMPSGTPFALSAMLNQNVNKLYDYIREKLGIALKNVFNEWVVPNLIKEIKVKDILKLTKDPSYVKRYKDMLVDSWYLNNLLAIGPHSSEIALMLKQGVREQLNKKEDFYIKNEKEFWEDFKATVDVVITGENVNIQAQNIKYTSFVQLETDPIRRTALIEKLYAMNGIDVSTLPKSTPGQMQPVNTQSEGMPIIAQSQPQTI